MSKLRRVDIERSKEIFEEIEKYVKVVIEKLDPHIVILFGSFASGDINEGSDIDLLVVANFEEPFLDRIGTLMEMNRFRIPIEPVGYTPYEFKEMVNGKNTFIMEVVEKGRVMYRHHAFNIY